MIKSLWYSKAVVVLLWLVMVAWLAGLAHGAIHLARAAGGSEPARVGSLIYCAFCSVAALSGALALTAWRAGRRQGGLQ